MGYITVERFKDLTTLPAEYVDELEVLRAGWLAAQIDAESAWIDARLGKRYATPFDPISPPVMVERWVAWLVTMNAWSRRGYDPNTADIQPTLDGFKQAKEEIKEAADAVDGLFELPLRSDTTAQGISRGGPRTYSEASPYVAFDDQSCNGRYEDTMGQGQVRR